MHKLAYAAPLLSSSEKPWNHALIWTNCLLSPSFASPFTLTIVSGDLLNRLSLSRSLFTAIGVNKTKKEDKVKREKEDVMERLGERSRLGNRWIGDERRVKMRRWRGRLRVEGIIQRMRDSDSARRRDVDGGGTEGISKQTGRWGGWVERHNDCRSAGNDKEREKPEMDTQQSFAVALANNSSNPHPSLLSFPLCCRLLCMWV